MGGRVTFSAPDSKQVLKRHSAVHYGSYLVIEHHTQPGFTVLSNIRCYQYLLACLHKKSVQIYLESDRTGRKRPAVRSGKVPAEEMMDECNVPLRYPQIE